MKKPVILLLAAASGTFAIAGPGAASNEYRNKYGDELLVADCGDGDTVAYAGPVNLWPPNHKMQNVSMTATDGDDGELPPENTMQGTSLTVAPDLEDVEGGDGGPNHDPDWSGEFTKSGEGSATVNFALRAERSGKGEGRTYTLNWVATFDGVTAGAATKTCTSSDEGQKPFEVFVPHDMRGGADWK